MNVTSTSFACVFIVASLSFFSTLTMAQGGWDDDHAMFLLEGHCPVVLHEESSWVRGNTAYSSNYEGAKYVFASERALKLFQANPQRYAAVCSGCDVVIAEHEGTFHRGDRRHGVVYQERVFLFTSETTLRLFWANPERYASIKLSR